MHIYMDLYIYVNTDKYFYICTFTCHISHLCLTWMNPLLVWVLCHLTGFARLVWGRLQVCVCVSLCKCSPSFLTQRDLCNGLFLFSSLSHSDCCGARDAWRFSGRGVSHLCTSDGTHMNESCHTYKWVMSHIWVSHVTPTNESCHTYEWVMSHIRMSHVTHMNESCHTYEWVMSHIRTSHVTHMIESCHIYEWVMSHIWRSHVTHTNESSEA